MQGVCGGEAPGLIAHPVAPYIPQRVSSNVQRAKRFTYNLKRIFFGYGTRISLGSSSSVFSASISTVTWRMPTIFHWPPILARVMS